MQPAKKLVRKFVPSSALKVVEKLFRKGRGLFYMARYGFPARGMRVIAITGTNGKSTTCAYVNEVLKAAGYKTAVLTTIFYEIDGKITPNKTHQTIHKQSIVQSFFAQAKKADVDFVILEVTSHALDQDRIMGVPVEIAIITNLTQEHLDYHKTMAEYARVKSLLLRSYGAKWAILNIDDNYYEYFLDRSYAKVFSIGKKTGATGKISSVKLTKDWSTAKLKTEDHTVNLKTKLIGEYNLYNAAAAASVGLLLNVAEKDIEKGITSLEKLDGRAEELDLGQDYRVLIDFAITPDAIEKVLESLQKITTGKVRIVFGATGDRDKAKRPIMGQVAAKHADFIYLTDDETYTDDGNKIREEVYAGIEKAKATKKTKIIPDRGEAIKAALGDARKGDTVLITGLGHEDTRNMGGKLTPWSDKDTVKNILTKL